MDMKQLQRRGYELGRKACKANVKPIAVLDATAMTLIQRNQEHTSLILAAWTRGWQAGAT